MANRTTSGARAEAFNPRERAVSDDLVRLQQFSSANQANRALRKTVASSTSATSGGKTTVPSTVGTPPAAIVYEGLTPRPEVGTTSLFVEPGVVAIVFPDGDPHPDDSVCRLVEDPGVQVAGDPQTVLTPGGVATRIDVLECQPLTVVQETDNRDRFNPATGTFSPVLVNKVTRGGLAYRVRLGTPGGGFPGVVSGWLPLMVARVPTTAVTWDDCDCWDVRPLYSDLTHSRVLSESFPPAARASGVVANNGVSWAARGVFEGELSGWRAGGELASSSSGLTSLDLALAANQEPGFAVVNNALWYLYLAQPFGLPRWCKLNPAATLNRDPGSLRGIPVLTQAKAPVGLSGRPAVAVSLPTATGLAGSTTNALLVAAGFMVGGTLSSTVTARGRASHRTTPSLAPSAGAGTANVTYTFAPNVVLPANAVEMRLQFTMTIADAAGNVHPTSVAVTVLDSGGLSVATYTPVIGTDTVPLTGTYGLTFEMWLPVPPSYPAGGTQTFTVTVAHSAGAFAPTYSGQLARVFGWRLGA